MNYQESDTSSIRNNTTKQPITKDQQFSAEFQRYSLLAEHTYTKVKSRGWFDLGEGAVALRCGTINISSNDDNAEGGIVMTKSRSRSRSKDPRMNGNGNVMLDANGNHLFMVNEGENVPPVPNNTPNNTTHGSSNSNSTTTTPSPPLKLYPPTLHKQSSRTHLHLTTGLSSKPSLPSLKQQGNLSESLRSYSMSDLSKLGNGNVGGSSSSSSNQYIHGVAVDFTTNTNESTYSDDMSELDDEDDDDLESVIIDDAHLTGHGRGRG
ncbi:hypothetical protein HDU76_007861, partial [Blyttiomyces sp. JEL0837]